MTLYMVGHEIDREHKPREERAQDGSSALARRCKAHAGEWLVTATLNDAGLTQVQSWARFDPAGFGGRQWTFDADGQQHPTLRRVMFAALRLAREQAAVAAALARVNAGRYRPCEACGGTPDVHNTNRATFVGHLYR